MADIFVVSLSSMVYVNHSPIRCLLVKITPSDRMIIPVHCLVAISFTPVDVPLIATVAGLTVSKILWSISSQSS